MTVGKISANVVSNMVSGSSAENKTPETSYATEPKKDNKKVLMWALGGLALAGAAGVLIYNARKGRSAGAGAAAGAGFSFGTFAKKFADESIFAKTIENVQNKVDGINFRQEKGHWEMSNIPEQFGCRLLKPEQADANGFVSCFDFSSREMAFQVLNHKDGKTIFNVGEGLAVTVDSASGKVSEVFSELDGIGAEHCQKFVDDLDLKKLIDDSDYRKNYCKSIRDVVGEIVEKESLSAIADKTGKTFDEIKGIQDSAEFQDYWRSMAQLGEDIHGVNNGLNRFHGLFNVPESVNIQKIFGFVEGKDKFYFLEDFVTGNKGFEYRVNMIEDGSGLIPRQTVAEIRDLSVPDERLKIGDGSNGEFFAYERYNEDMTGFVNIRYYNPAEFKDGNARVTMISTKDLSLNMEETADGVQHLTVRRGDEVISEAQCETLMNVLKDESMRATFIKDFVTRGTEMLQSYLG